MLRRPLRGSWSTARLYAARKGWLISEDHVFTDAAISGAEFQNRPGFLRL